MSIRQRKRILVKTYFAVHAYAGREGGVASTAFRFVLRGGTECTIRVR